MAQSKSGKVLSVKMNKTVVVEVHYRVKHPLYKKQISRTKKFKARDEIGVAVGEIVTIVETAPISKTVHFKVAERANDVKTKK